MSILMTFRFTVPAGEGAQQRLVDQAIFPVHSLDSSNSILVAAYYCHQKSRTLHLYRSSDEGRYYLTEDGDPVMQTVGFSAGFTLANKDPRLSTHTKTLMMPSRQSALAGFRSQPIATQTEASSLVPDQSARESIFRSIQSRLSHRALLGTKMAISIREPRWHIHQEEVTLDYADTMLDHTGCAPGQYYALHELSAKDVQFSKHPMSVLDLGYTILYFDEAVSRLKNDEVAEYIQQQQHRRDNAP